MFITEYFPDTYEVFFFICQVPQICEILVLQPGIEPES